MKRLFCLLLALAATSFVQAKPVAKTYTKLAPKSKVTVVHAGAGWNADCIKMMPDWLKFESKFAGKVTLVNINTEKNDTPEFKKYAPTLTKERGVPLTYWFSDKGVMLAKHQGVLKGTELEAQTNHWLGLDKKAPKAKPKNSK